MRYEIELERVQPIHTALIRDRVTDHVLARFVPAACGEVWSFVRSAKLPRPGRHCALYLDEHRTVEVGVEVAEPLVGNDRVHCSKLPAGRMVTTVHFGPYQLSREAHSANRLWCAEQKCQLSGVSWGFYGHWQESWNVDKSKSASTFFICCPSTVFIAWTNNQNRAL